MFVRLYALSYDRGKQEVLNKRSRQRDIAAAMNSLQIIFNSRRFIRHILWKRSLFLVWYLSGLASLDYTNFIAEWAFMHPSLEAALNSFNPEERWRAFRDLAKALHPARLCFPNLPAFDLHCHSSFPQWLWIFSGRAGMVWAKVGTARHGTGGLRCAGWCK